MRLPEFEYYEPDNIDDAVKQLNKNNKGTVIAGGTDLLVALKQRLQVPEYLLSLEKIPSIKKMEKANGSVTIGSMCLLNDIASSQLIADTLPALKSSAWEVGSPLLRTLATIGGNICLNTRCRFYNQSQFWRSSREPCYKAGGSVCHVTGKKETCYAAFCADIPPVLVAYGASIKLVGPNSSRSLPLEEFYTGDSHAPNDILAGSGEILTEIEIPLQNNTKSCYRKFRLRDSIDFPLVGVAVRLHTDERNRCLEAQIVLSGVSSAPVVAAEGAESLLGNELSSELIFQAAERASFAAHPLKTDLISPRYKREVTKVVVAEAIAEAGGMKI